VPTYRLLAAYDGGGFHGFARQSELPTIQGALEDALSKVLGEPIVTSAAGRTDAGVHALGQVVSFKTNAPVADPTDLKRRLNSMCGPAIAILDAAEAQDGFDARFSAIGRTYEYAILHREVHDPFSRATTWHHPEPLDVEAMRKAAQSFLGEHDFTSFGRVENGRSPVRRVEEIEVDQHDEVVIIRIAANSFVQQMVRSIVGTLVKIGEGKLHPEDVETILLAKDRAAAGPVAPPHGLFLVAVTYPEELV
jgi:tRNA pseudouridine38-40 synthase